MTSDQIRVLCVDDHAIVREGIGLLIDRQPDMRVVAFAATADEAYHAFCKERPDVTLMDLRLRSGDGSTAIQKIITESPQARIIVLTMYEGDEDIHRALHAGAVAYLLKDTLSDDLIDAVRVVHSGHRPVSKDISDRLAGRSQQPALTPREIGVLELLATGMRNKTIADALSISELTVQVHMKNIFAKLHVNDRTGAIHIAAKRGIVHLV